VTDIKMLQEENKTTKSIYAINERSATIETNRLPVEWLATDLFCGVSVSKQLV
jgi:hypothetical protein